MASGQKVNLNKSKVWYTPNTARETIQNITNSFGVPSTVDLGLLDIPTDVRENEKHNISECSGQSV